MKIKTKRYYLYALLKIGYFILLLFPIRVAAKLGEYIGLLAYYVISPQRKITSRQLACAFPEKSTKEIRAIAKKVFKNIIRNAVEFASFSKVSCKQMPLWLDKDHLYKIKENLKHGKGVIILTGHFGNWELVGQFIMLKGFKGSTIVKELYFSKYEGLLKKLRGINGLETIDRRESPRKMLKVLKENKLLGILADQDIKSIGGVFVDFFGKPALTAVAPVKIAKASGAPILISFVVREGSRYKFIVEDPFWVKKDDCLKKMTQKWTEHLQRYIMKYPDQWVWMHKRWETKPGDIVTEI